MRTAGWLAIVAVFGLAGCKSEFDFDGNSTDVTGPDGDSENLSDDGDSPNIRITPQAMSFGTKLPACPTEPSYFTIQNIGVRDLSITDMDFDGSNGVFTMTPIHDFSSPLVIAPQQSVQVPIVFEASTTGVAYSGVLEVASNDPDTPVETAGVEGAGGDTATNEDLFYQSQPEGVDVLWVLDNSCSMSSHLTSLETEFNSFISSFTTLGLDYQLAVTTTDMTVERGALLGPVPVISPALAAAAGMSVEEAFDLAVEPNTLGSADEQALMAAKTSLSPGGPGALAGLIRPSANLAVIVVGDEDDSSSLTAPAFVSWLQSLKPDPEKTTISGIIQQSTSLFDTNCSGMNSPKLIAAIDASGGIRTGICDLDFNQVLRWLSYSAAGLDSVFPLTDTPLNRTVGMRVSINGQAATRDPFHSDGWAYIPSSNSVVFYGNSLPGPGAEVRIEYPVAGTCD